jgi:hypothetical protein
MYRLGRAAVTGAVAVAAVTTLFNVPAEAGTWLPTCGAPADKACVAIDNRTSKGDSALLSFRAMDGTCLSYKGDWGPGDVVGWPTVYVKDTASQLVKDAYHQTGCAGKSVSFWSSGLPSKNGAYLVVQVGL